jgi:hypothetical protein
MNLEVPMKNKPVAPSPDEVSLFMKAAMIRKLEVCTESRMALTNMVMLLEKRGLITKKVLDSFMNLTKGEVRNLTK